MRTSSAVAAPIANNADAISDVEPQTDGISAVDDENWFSVAAHALLPCKAGTALHYATGFEERACQKYAAGSVKPPAYFLRSLLRSEQGWQWLAVLMEGAEPQWWADIQRARLDSALLRELVDEVTK